MIRPRTNYELVKETLSRFGSSDDVYSIPAETNRPFPRRYVAYGLGDAAVDTLFGSGYSPQQIGRSLNFKERIARRAMQAVPDLPEIMKAREERAYILNNYSIEGAFNPN